MTKVDEYVNEMPFIVRQGFKALSSDISLAILFVLYKYGKLTSEQIKEELEIDSETFDSEIKKILKGAFVDHYTVFENNERKDTYYEITEYAIEMLKSIICVLAVQFKHKKGE